MSELRDALTEALYDRLNIEPDDTNRAADAILAHPAMVAALRATDVPSAHGPTGNEGYCRCGYFGGGREHRDLADHLRATDVPSDGLREALERIAALRWPIGLAVAISIATDALAATPAPSGDRYVRATAKGTAISTDEWNRPLYICLLDIPYIYDVADGRVATSV